MAGVDKDAISQFSGPNPKYKVSIDPTNNNTVVTGTGSGADALAIYLYVDKDGNFSIYKNRQDAIDRYAADIQAAGAVETIRQRLYEMGKISKKEYDSKSAAAYNSGLGDYINDFTVAQATAIANSTAKSFTPLLGWARSSSGGNVPSTSTTVSSSKDVSTTTSTDKSVSTDVSTYINLSSAAAANNELDLFFQQQLGRNASDLEKAAYLISLNSAEKALATTSTTTSDTTSTSERTGTTTSDTTSKTVSGVASSKTSSTGKSASTQATTGTSTGVSTRTSIGGNITAEDRTKLMSGVLGNSLKDLTTDDIIRSGGAVAQGIYDLLAFAGDYALPNYNKDTAKNDIISKLKSGMPVGQGLLDSEKVAIKSLAKAFYPNMSSLIDQGVKVSNVADIYAQQLGKVLEVPYTGVDIVNNKYIQMALQNKNADGVVGKEGTLNLDDFTKILRKDPAWAKTQNAREEASSYAMRILQSFGLVG